jgi:hypothetical protein
MAIQGATKRILNAGTEEGRSFESFESLHKFCNRNGSKKMREYLANCTPTATDAAGTAKAVASSTAVANKSVATKTLVAACDADTPAMRAMHIHVMYFNTSGVKKEAHCTLGANATTETAFTDVTTGTAVTDFYCFNTDDYGSISSAPTYASCIVAGVALGAVTNLCVGITGLVAGIADPDICFGHVNTTKVYPLLADLYGQGHIWEEREADDVADDSLVQTITYLTPWGELKTATVTTTATHTDIIRFIKADLSYVSDFYRIRTYESTQAFVKAHHICDHDGATHYAVIEALAMLSCHTSFMAIGEAYGQSFIGEVEMGASSLTGLTTVKITYTPFGSAIAITITRQFYHNNTWKVNQRLAPLSNVSMTVQDDTGDLTILTAEVPYVEALV